MQYGDMRVLSLGKSVMKIISDVPTHSLGSESKVLCHGICTPFESLVEDK